MSKFNLSTNHPLIPNANQYLNETKYLSIHSEDRDIIKYPDSSEFEIELPQDYVNVQSLSLVSWSFPSNYNVFSDFNANRKMTFGFKTLYNPSAHGASSTDPVIQAMIQNVQNIYDVLTADPENEFIVTIQEGFYSPEEMAVELTAQFNASVSNYLLSIDSSMFDVDAYNGFVVYYNSVQQKLWFGNTRDQFELINDSTILAQKEFLDTRCVKKNVLPEFANWGLPSFLGFTRCSIESVAPDYSVELVRADTNIAPYKTDSGDLIVVPRNYSTDTNQGLWLLPDADLPGSLVYFLKPPMKINLMGQSYLYMELSGYNCLDETSPYSLSKFTATTNQTNGVVNSAFAKLSIPTTPVTQWYDDSSPTYKWFNPPAERIRRLKVKIRYHNGQKPEFGDFDYSFMIGFQVLNPQMERKSSVFTVG
jgi:hypothetical protein